MNWFMAFLHHLAAFVLFATLILELVMIKEELNQRNLRKLLAIDSIYGAMAGALLVIGGLRIFFYEKGVDYYLYSAPFITKLLLFATVGLLSIYPTVTFLSWRKALSQNMLPDISRVTLARIRLVIHLELVAIAGILLCAAMTAKGAGYLSD